jgi:hypothetical protein
MYQTTAIQPRPLLDRIAARAEEPRQPRWIQLQAERIAERERAGGSRWEAVADLTGLDVAL